MRILIGLIIVFICCNSCSKKLTVENPNYNIEEKAKLLTVSEFGVANSDLILKDVLSQKIDYIDFGFENFLFMEIILTQNHWLDSDSQIVSENLYCKRIIVYNKITKRFYPLRNGSSLNVKELINDIYHFETEPLKFISKQRTNNSSLDLFCVFEYVNNDSDAVFECINKCRR
jgi:hypothetical protein